MKITARFASTCSTCRRPIAIGSMVEWSKGSNATHVVCVAPADTTIRVGSTVACQTPGTTRYGTVTAMHGGSTPWAMVDLGYGTHAGWEMNRLALWE